MSLSRDLAGLLADRLRAHLPEFITVGSAVDFAELVERGQRPQRLPAAFVLPLGDDAALGDLLGVDDWLQQVEERVAVVLVHQDRGDASGDKARSRLVPLAARVRAEIAGWHPSPLHGPCHYLRSRLHGLTAGAVWQQLDFQCRSELET